MISLVEGRLMVILSMGDDHNIDQRENIKVDGGGVTLLAEEKLLISVKRRVNIKYNSFTYIFYL